MNLIRILIISLIGYLILRLVRSKKKSKPEVRSRGNSKRTERFKQADIVDVSYTEVPDSERETEPAKENDKESEGN